MKLIKIGETWINPEAVAAIFPYRSVGHLQAAGCTVALVSDLRINTEGLSTNAAADLLGD